jgi:voltage-gated potassium channel
MASKRLYRFLDPGAFATDARLFRGLHHVLLTAGIGVMLANTMPPWRLVWAGALDAGFSIVCAFFVAEYVLRLSAAPGAPGTEHRGKWRARLAWTGSIGGVCDLVGTFPAVLAIVRGPVDASLFAFVWVFKLVRYAPGLASLQQVISDARHALTSVLLGFCIVLLLSASLAYLLERDTQPEAFGSIPDALWWAIVTLTTTGYGDVIPQTAAGRVLAGVVMVSGILVFALWAGILATGFAEETRRREFLRTWELVANVPFLHDIGASAIADVARLLRPRDYPAGAVVVRRGETGDCMYFVASGEVEIRLTTQSIYLGAGQFFGEIALLSGAPRNATVATTQRSILLSLDIVDFRELLGRHTELARVIHDEAERRLTPANAEA